MNTNKEDNQLQPAIREVYPTFMLRTLGEVHHKREQKRISTQERVQMAEFDLKNKVLELNGQIKQ